MSGTGSFTCPVAQTRLDIPRPSFTQSWTAGGGGQSAPVQGRFKPPTCRSIVEHANHQTTMTAPIGGSIIAPVLNAGGGAIGGSSAAPPRGSPTQGAVECKMKEPPISIVH